MTKIANRKIVIVNQAVNYLTIGLANAFKERFEDVHLITGSIHTQGEELNPSIEVHTINKWHERPARKKMFSYIQACFRIFWLLSTKYRKHEVFFVSIPPMAYLLNILLPNRFSMIIWDVFPDAFKITGMKESHFLYRGWAYLNKISFKKAYRLFTIGDKMAEILSQYVEREKLIVQPIWSIFQSDHRIAKTENKFVQLHNLDEKFVVQYSGNIGLTHKVEVMVKLAEMLKDNPDILFQIIGRGPRVPVLKKMVEEKQLPNCVFLPFQADDMFMYSLSAADLGMVILDELTAKASVPSKSYNLMSLGIPSLYIASEDSELHNYAEKFFHAKCYSEYQLEEAKNFILKIKNNKELWQEMSGNSERASQNFKRPNADKFVEKYLE